MNIVDVALLVIAAFFLGCYCSWKMRRRCPVIITRPPAKGPGEVEFARGTVDRIYQRLLPSLSGNQKNAFHDEYNELTEMKKMFNEAEGN
jgi:hypothetical protein